MSFRRLIGPVWREDGQRNLIQAECMERRLENRTERTTKMTKQGDPFFEAVVAIADAICKFVKDAEKAIANHSVTDPPNRRYLMLKSMEGLLRDLERIRQMQASGNSFTIGELNALFAALDSFRNDLSKLTL